MKIAVGMRNFIPEKGGAERSVAELMSFLSRAGHDVHVFAHRFGKFENSFVLHRVPAIPFPKSLKVLSFTENILYLGTMSPETLSRFFPGDFDPDLIWAVLRGYPHLIGHQRIASLRANQISLFNWKEREVERIDFSPESRFPRRASFPERHLAVAFLGFQEDSGLYYAREVRVKSMKGRRRLLLKNRNMVFNKPIPEEIFILEKPPMFETVNLDTTPHD